MQILQPLYLLLLSGLLLPLAIHLWNRKKGKVVEMGTLRFLQALPKEQISSIQLTQKRLLLLRSLILILPILLLVGILLKNREQSTFKSWVLLSPELVNNPSIHTRLASYNSDSFNIFLSDKTLTPYQVEESENIIIRSQIDYAALLTRINNMPIKPDSLVIYTLGQQNKFSKVPKVDIPIYWVQIPEKGTDIAQITSAWSIDNDSLKLLNTVSNAAFSTNNWLSTSLQTAANEWEIIGDSLILDVNTSIPIQKTSLNVLLVAKDTSANSVFMMKAAFRTLNNYLGTDIKVKVSSYKNDNFAEADHYFLIDPTSIQDYLPEENICLIRTGNLAVQQSSYLNEKFVLPQIYLDTKSDRQDAILVSHLANCLFPQLGNALHLDSRILDEKQLKQFSNKANSGLSQRVRQETSNQTSGTFNYFIMGLCAILIGVERWLSVVKK